MILERLLGLDAAPDPTYPGPPHVVERRHRDGSWLPVALGIRAHDAVEALGTYRQCIPSNIWQHVEFRARLQAQDEFGSRLVVKPAASTG